ncbi:hypothetical protein [Peribacillus sp. SI8-4]|uniref:hypothetical protein n=1 Tax=Peribacillus sp. SI8-4 TaxID=3048009 RepID=UPI0025570438|nr:hypothetical protein [Peribacillus sp. SI8-4]
MSNLIPLTIATEAFLLLSFIIMYVSIGKSKRNILLVILLIIGGGPLLYFVIDDLYSNYADANIGLGLAFMFTWVYSVVAFIVAILLLLVKKKSDHDSSHET